MSQRRATIQPGLCSITFRRHTPEQVVELAAGAGLSCIEWGGDVHVPPGDTAVAERVRGLTESAGLRVSSYGSYYRAGVEGESSEVRAVVDSAQALGAPVIRVWAGKAEGGDSLPEQPGMWERTVADLRAAGELAQARGLGLGIEYHRGTYTATDASAKALIRAVDHPAVGLYWQPNQFYADDDERRASLDVALPHLVHLHVFHWRRDAEGEVHRKPLAQGAELWRAYLRAVVEAAGPGQSFAALMEFVAGNDPDQFREDAATLVRLVREVIGDE